MRDIVLGDWQDFVQQAEELQRVSETRGSTRQYIFRGVPKASYGLKPSLLRLLEGGVPDPSVALTIEHEALKEFIRQAHLHLQTGLLATLERRPEESFGPDIISWWTLMQHHNAPTRLLDWTRSAFVAAYFTIEKDPSEDGAIWVLDAAGLLARVKAAHNRANMPPPDHFEEKFLDKMAVAAVWPIERPRATERIVAQQGVFTIAEQILTDHGERIEQLPKEDREMFFRLIVAVEENISRAASANEHHCECSIPRHRRSRPLDLRTGSFDWMARHIKGGANRRLFASYSWASMAHAARLLSSG